MSLREKLNDKPMLSAVVAVGLIGIAACTAMSGPGEREAKPLIKQLWFYDLGAKKLFAAPAASVAPIMAPSGADQGVRAYVFACENCEDEGDRFIAYLEKYSSKAKRVVEAGGVVAKRDDRTLSKGIFVGSVSGEWAQVNKPEAASIVSAGFKKCPGNKAPMTCLPVE